MDAVSQLDPDSPIKEMEAKHHQIHLLEKYASVLKFLGLLYYSVVIPIRVSFQCYPIIEAYWPTLLLDYAFDAFFFVDFVLGSNYYEKIKENKLNWREVLHVAFEVFIFVPLELILFGAGYKYFGEFRISKLLRWVYLHSYWNGFTKALKKYLYSATSQRVVFFLIGHFLLAVYAACLMFGIGLAQARQRPPIRDLMITQSGLGVFEGDELVLLHSCSYRFLRLFYYGVTLVETNGYGDILPRSVAERSVAIFIFYAAWYLTGVTVSNFITMINGLDAATKLYLDRSAKLFHFCHLKHIPISFQKKISAYYRHQLDVLGCIDEKQLLAELPWNVQHRIVQQTVTKYLLKVNAISSLKPAIINRLAECCKHYNFSPGDLIVAADSTSKGLYICSRGKLKLTGANHVAIKEFHEGEYFGEKALVKPYSFPFTVVAGNVFSVILFLSRSKFKHTCDLLLDQGGNTAVLETVGNSDEMEGITPTALQAGGETVADGEAEEIASRHSIWSPKSKFRVLWNCIVFIGIVFHLVEVPMMVGDMLDSSWYQRYYRELVACAVFDAILAIDLLFRLQYFYFFKDGQLHTKKSDILEHYRSHGYLLLIFDVLAVLPLDLFVFATGYTYLPVLRIGKMLRMVHLPTLSVFLKHKLRSGTGIILPFTESRITLMLLLLFALCHYLGCLYSFVGDFAHIIWGTDSNWKLIDTNTPYSTYSYRFHGDDVYKRSIYWVMNTLSTNGNGDMAPKNIVETVYVTALQLFGCSVVVAILGNIGSLMSMIGADRRNFEGKLSKLKELLELKGIDEEVTKKIFFFHEYKWERTGGIDENELLGNLSMTLKEGLVECTLGLVVVHIPFFSSCRSHMIERILSTLVPRSYLDGDLLIEEGKYSVELFIIDVGVVEVTSADQTMVFAKLGHGGYVGESSLLKLTRTNASVYSRSYCDVYVLSKKSFEHIATLFPTECSAIREGVEKTLKEKNDLNRQMMAQVSLGTDIIEEDDLEFLDDNSVPNTAMESAESGIELKRPTPKLLGEIDKPASIIFSERAGANRRGSFLSSILDIGSKGHSFFEHIQTEDNASSASSSNNDILDSFFHALHARTDKADQGISQRDFEEKLSGHYKDIANVIICVVVLYNFSVVPFRIAFMESRYLFIDYIGDGILLIDSFLHWTVYPVVHGGMILRSKQEIRKLYVENELLVDVLARFPYELLVFLIYYTQSYGWGYYEILIFLRIPVLMIALKFRSIFQSVETVARESGISFLYLRLSEIFLGLLFLGHWAGLGFLMVARFKPNVDCEPTEDVELGTNCDWRGTWLSFLILNGKLPSDGGTQWDKYLRCLNWGVPTLTLFVIGDTFPMNINEATYIFVALFFGVCLQGFLVGNVMTVTAPDTKIMLMSETADRLQYYLKDRGVNESLIHRAYAYFNTLMKDGIQLQLEEHNLISELPHSLQIKYCQETRLSFLKQCDFLDHCPVEVLTELALGLELRSYGADDVVIHAGDIGSEMYFVHLGEVAVTSADGSQEYSTLQEGAFFGETSLFFNTVRSANIKAKKFCLLYVLHKQLINDTFRRFSFDGGHVVNALVMLQDRNKWRNKAIADNLSGARDPDSKIAKILRPFDETPVKMLKFFKFFDTESKCRAVIDAVELFMECWFAISVPYTFAFFPVSGKGFSGALAFEYAMCCVAILLLVMKYRMWEYARGHPVLTFPWKLKKYSMICDAIGLIPIELFVLLPGVPFKRIWLFRLIRLVRIYNLPRKFNEIADRSVQYLMRIPSQTMSVLKISIGVAFFNHWACCIYFAIHRYILINSQRTIIIGIGLAHYDEDIGEHTICDQEMSVCYNYMMYFMAFLISSVGYGDSGPYQNIEFVCQITFVTIITVFATILYGQLGNMQVARDSCNHAAFDDKLRNVLYYVDKNNFDPELRELIKLYYEDTWKRERSLGDKNSSYLSVLSDALASDILVELHRDALFAIPVMVSASHSVLCSFAYSMKFQTALPGTVIFEEHDSELHMFFVSSGLVRVVHPPESIQSKEQHSNSLSVDYTLSELLLLKTIEVSGGGFHPRGSHFGETFMTHGEATRGAVATVLETSELLSIAKPDMLKILASMPHDVRCKFILEIFCTAGTRRLCECPPIPEDDQNPSDIFTMESLYRLATQLVELVVKQFAELDETGEVAVVSEIRKKQIQLRRMFSEEYEGEYGKKLQALASPMNKTWDKALQDYQIEHQKSNTNLNVAVLPKSDEGNGDLSASL